MTPWARKRQIIYLSGLILFLFIIVGIPTFFLLYEEPTCFDGVKNGEETGVDCGGSCDRVCTFQITDPIIHWDEAFEVRPSVWSAVALVENPNEARASDIPYTFRLLDEKGILISEITGFVDIPSKQRFAVYESDINVGNRNPSQDFFTLDISGADWEQPDDDRTNLEVLNSSLGNSSTGGMKLDATIRNNETHVVYDIDAVGILYDIDGNMVASSKTLISFLDGGESQDIVFTWPGQFERSVTRKEILLRVLDR